MNTLLEVENISYNIKGSGFPGLRKSGKEILKNISFSLEKGKILGIAGESGSGKTTLAKIISGIIPYSGGKIVFSFTGKMPNSKLSPVQILFQNNGETLNPFRQINKVIEEAIAISAVNSADIELRKKEILDWVNLPEHLWSRRGMELSGGEQQRAALARILAVNPELLILDEPFSAQDAESRLNLLKLIKEINASSGITIICISHNINILRKLCDEIIIMYKGKIVESGDTEKIFSAPAHPYTRFLIKADGYELSYEEVKSEFEKLTSYG